MISLVSIALCVGLLCGLRLSIVVFLPASVCVAIFGIVAAAARGASFGQLVLAAVLGLVGLQAGYVGGLFVRAFWPVAKKAGSKATSARLKR